jgi:hypothetical protein
MLLETTFPPTEPVVRSQDFRLHQTMMSLIHQHPCRRRCFPLEMAQKRPPFVDFSLSALEAGQTPALQCRVSNPHGPHLCRCETCLRRLQHPQIGKFACRVFLFGAPVSTQARHAHHRRILDPHARAGQTTMDRKESGSGSLRV